MSRPASRTLSWRIASTPPSAQYVLYCFHPCMPITLQNLYNNVTYMYPNATIWLIGHSVRPHIRIADGDALTNQLGGSISALIGLSFGAPVVTVEAPGDLLPARRLHLPLPPGMPADKTGITHVYHNADPIPMGACTGAYSGCYAAGFVRRSHVAVCLHLVHAAARALPSPRTCCGTGFAFTSHMLRHGLQLTRQAMESKCHTGQTILYDTVTVKGWSVDVRTHRIDEIINKVLADPWPGTDGPDDPREVEAVSIRGVGSFSFWSSWWGWGGKGPKGKEPEEPANGDKDGDGGWERHGGVPKAQAEDQCVDCFKW